MEIKEQLEKMPIKNEIEYIISFIIKYKNLWNKNKFVFLRKNTIEDEVFLKIYWENRERIGTLFFLKSIEELEDTDAILINTDNKITTNMKISRFNTTYTLNIFADYYPEYITEMAKYYNINLEEIEENNYCIEKELIKCYEQYLDNKLDIFSLKTDLQTKFLNLLKEKNKKTNRNILNSYNLRLYS